jgi:L-alanine-DL-glutamate epimerase-like enolase superfamily enzyme
MWDIVGKVAGLPLYQLLGGKVRNEVMLCGLMGVQEPEDAADTAKLYVEKYGFPSIKTKAGRNIYEDIAICESLKNAVGDKALLRFDANQSYTADMFRRISPHYQDDSIEYFEEPFESNSLHLLKDINVIPKIPIALNESVTDDKSAYRLASLSVADYFVIDLPESGGISEILKVAAVAAAAKIKCVFHCWHDLGIKTAVMAHIVCSNIAFTQANDTTYHGLIEDIITVPHNILKGAICAPNGPGIGVEPDPYLLDKYRKKEID